MTTPPPTTLAGAPSSATSPGAAALPLRIDTQKTWSRINTWLSTPAAAAAGAKGTEAKRLLGLAKDVWEQPGQAVPLVLQACQLAGLEDQGNSLARLFPHIFCEAKQALGLSPFGPRGGGRGGAEPGVDPGPGLLSVNAQRQRRCARRGRR